METDSSKIKAAWAIADKRQFCKQSCTKISQGLDKLDNRSSERAIWELFQNARDLAMYNNNGEKEAHIKITITPNEFIFAHKGRPFTHDSFSSLVKQVSAQEKEDEESVGQYGTGFLTTHSFGRRIFVKGSLDLEDQAPGKFVNIDNFEIDRVFDDIPSFVDKMAVQLFNIDAFADAPMTDECREWTELHYQLSSADNATEKVRKGIDAAIKVMPYVMTVNKPIGDVEITDVTTGINVRFSKEIMPAENGLHVAGINIESNGISQLKKIYYLQSENGDDTAILPLKDSTNAESLQGIAKLFVFFPLLGTEDFGMDVVFHSNRFFPVEERDALHLPVENANVKSKYEANVKVLNEMSDMVFNYCKEHSHEIKGWVNVAKLSFECLRNKEDVTNKFFTEFKAKWVTFFENLPMIDINGSRKSIASRDVNLYSSNMLIALEADSTDWNDALYKVANFYGNVPSLEFIKDWSRIVASWYVGNEACFLSYGKLAEKLQISAPDTDMLLNFDRFLSSIGQNVMFEQYKLIPNRDGVLKRKSELRDANTIPDWICTLVQPFIPEIVSKFVDTRFSIIDTLVVFSRNELKTQLNDALIKIANTTIHKTIPCVCNKTQLKQLALLCLISANASVETGRSRRMKVICDYLGINYNLMELVPLNSGEHDLADLAFKHLVENLLLEISQMDTECVSANLSYIHSLHEVLTGWSPYYSRDTKEGFAKKYGAFPSKLNQTSLASDLKIGIDIPEELMEFYQSIMGSNLKAILINDDFTSFCDFDKVNAIDVAKEIEAKLEEEDFKNNSVLDIIDWIDRDSRWESWFPHIAKTKADIFLKQVKPQCKDSVYRLMKVDDPDKLEQLADLADQCDMDEILRLGREAVTRKQNEEADFEYKKQLGEYVETFLEKELTSKLGEIFDKNSASIKVTNDQYGHDLVVLHNDTPIYFIEVKSRWGSQQSVELSKLQLRSCVANADRYALCCVNMTGVNHKDVERHEYPNVEETIPRIKSLPNIGKLAEEVEKTTQLADNQIHLGGTYSCIVPQIVIAEYGIGFDALLDIIATVIQEKSSC